MYETKRISGPIVTDSLHKNPEVGAVVPENAVLNLGAFLLNKITNYVQFTVQIQPMVQRKKGVLISIL